jgi:hypothetical protein
VTTGPSFNPSQKQSTHKLTTESPGKSKAAVSLQFSPREDITSLAFKDKNKTLMIKSENANT